MQSSTRQRVQNKKQEIYSKEFTQVCVEKSEKYTSLEHVTKDKHYPDINNKIFDIYRDLLILQKKK
jgi:hypothetical protein